MNDTILDDWFTKSRAAAVLQVSEKTVERLARKGEIRRETRKRTGVRPSPVYCPEDLERVKAAQVPQVAVLPPPPPPPRRRPVVFPHSLPAWIFPRSCNRSYLVRTCR